ncbi:low affinity immunoglobulin gamma Fc region receptor III-A-like isoform X2 [Perognathus longimembris pacificus]|uniref:low affinity immunoglobulin gamma Fc region receptor III-A-like isoform X2 n=1 Tax=Perognathus longimembris pacificus TaxID=214514 RepID=UPI002018E779|nr:low affinity immunoglobulin gamma Fc region receptor III-A-like isoform X2 [Perognathus longimembris pacificus]
MFTGCSSMKQLLPLTVLLLLVSAGMTVDLPKAVVLLDPPWDRVLQEDSVTLKCQGTYPPGDNATQWLHNGSRISEQTFSYFIESARVEDSGEYRCQTGLSTLSDPVQLEVHIGWLLLQTTQQVFQEGETIWLKCHSWKNKPVQKVTYLRNGKGMKYFHWNSDFYIPDATHNHSGSYFCRGLIGHRNTSSEAVNIIVQGPASATVSRMLLWHQITFCLVMGVLFAINTGLYFSVWKNLRNSMEDRRKYKFQWSLDVQEQ